MSIGALLNPLVPIQVKRVLSLLAADTIRSAPSLCTCVLCVKFRLSFCFMFKYSIIVDRSYSFSQKKSYFSTQKYVDLPTNNKLTI